MKTASMLPLLTFALFTVAAATADAAPPSPPAQPVFSWDRVPRCIHFGKRRDLTDAQVRFLAANTPWVVLEKSHGATSQGSTEKGTAASARQIKAVAPEMKVLFYLNSFIKWRDYDAYESFQDEWLLRDKEGKIVTHPSGTPRFDPSQPAFRQWWAETVAKVHREVPLDGVFIDALPQAFAPDLLNKVGEAKAQAIIDGLREMIAMTDRLLGPERVIIVNGIRGGSYQEILDWPGIDYVMIEHFGAFKTRSAQDIKADLASIPLALSKGKGVIVKAWPEFINDRKVMKQPREQLLELARTGIDFPLACYLIGAQPGTYFIYGWGYTDTTGQLDSYPELERPLGPPHGDATWNGNRATRDFEHASVTLDLDARSATIQWKP